VAGQLAQRVTQLALLAARQVVDRVELAVDRDPRKRSAAPLDPLSPP
jgi:hypothetical protein